MRYRIVSVSAALALTLFAALPVLATAQTPTATPTALPTAAATPTAPTAASTAISVTSTNPPLAATVVLTGSQQAAANNPTFSIVSYPGKGTLTPVTAVTCTQIVAPSAGAASSIQCSASVAYTPVANATGSDSFSFTFTNASTTSAPATVSVTLPSASGAATATATPVATTATPVAAATPAPAGTATPTGTAAASGPGTFDRPLTLKGVTAAIWQGGSVEQLQAAGAAASATSVTAYVNGEPVVLVIGAPAFVNQSFALAFPGDAVPANTVVLVTIL